MGVVKGYIPIGDVTENPEILLDDMAMIPIYDIETDESAYRIADRYFEDLQKLIEVLERLQNYSQANP